MMRQLGRWIPALLLLAGLVGCKSEPAPSPVAQQAVVAAPIEAVPPGQAAPARDSVVAPPTVQTALDSLRSEINRLGGAIGVLQQAVAARIVGGDSASAAQADSTAAERTVAGVRHYGLRTVFAVIVFLGAFALVRALGWVFARLAERQAARRLFWMRFVPVLRIVVYVFAIYYIIAVVYAVDRNGLLAAFAAVGVGVGFASQGVLKNFFGGLIIIFDQPFQVGDKVDIGGTYGEVVSIGLRVTRIVTPDDSLVSVPNAAVVDSQVSNANSGALDCQVVVDLYLPGWVDVSQAKAIARSAAVMSKYCHLEKPVVVQVKDLFKETFLTHLEVKAYVLDTRYEFAFASDVTETAKMEFLRQGLLQRGLVARAFLELERPGQPPRQGDGEGAA